jgi:hypothetical protein
MRFETDPLPRFVSLRHNFQLSVESGRYDFQGFGKTTYQTPPYGAASAPRLVAALAGAAIYKQYHNNLGAQRGFAGAALPSSEPGIEGE